MTFAKQLKAARESALLTQEGAAAVLGISKRTYCDWEAGNVVPHRYMQEGALRDLRISNKRQK